MNMKKIMAGVVASALAVGTMAVAANAAAEDVKVKDTYTLTVTADKVNAMENPADGWYAGIQTGHVPGIKSLTIAYESADESGYLDIATNWGNDAAVPANNFAWPTDFNAWTGANLTAPEGSGLTGETAADYTLTLTVVIDTEDLIKQWYEHEDYGEMTSDGLIIVKMGLNTRYVDGAGTIYGDVTDAAAEEEGEDEPAAEDEGTDEPAATEEEGGDEPAPAEEAPTSTEAAEEAPTTTAAETAAPAAGTGNTATTTADKTNADTGVEGVAVVAGLAIVAAGAVIVAKKRK